VLLREHDFASHELVPFGRALAWFDRSDALCQAADAAAEAGARAALLKQAMDASTCALRYWRQLKFVDRHVLARRPGRPSDTEWSAKRKLAQVAG
jgi:hypothetical protein